MNLHVKRIYDPPAAEDGVRILVDRLWPRGLSREKARVDLWLKEIAPSTELRQWFDHDPQKWETFKQRYLQELDGHPDALAQLLEAIGAGPATLLFGARETRFNDAVTLREFILARARQHKPRRTH